MGRMWAQPTFLSTVTFVLLRFLSMTPHKHVSTFVIIRAEAGTQSICGFRPEACGNDELCLIKQLQRTFHQPVTVGSRGMTNCALYSDCGTRSAGFPALSRLLLGTHAGNRRAEIDTRSIANFFAVVVRPVEGHRHRPGRPLAQLGTKLTADRSMRWEVGASLATVVEPLDEVLAGAFRLPQVFVILIVEIPGESFDGNSRPALFFQLGGVLPLVDAAVTGIVTRVKGNRVGLKPDAEPPQERKIQRYAYNTQKYLQPAGASRPQWSLPLPSSHPR